ncbi:MAG: hypothetical protein HQM10_00740 [Candidatus Riflebacteria bacterium]|nr:hypothetical protein [Candidatus Riflebacteria bacterium]
MKKKITTTVHSDIYEKLHQIIGSTLRPHVLDKTWEKEYEKMANDKEREFEAMDWAEETIKDQL